MQDNEREDKEIAALEEDLWKQPTGTPPIVQGQVDALESQNFFDLMQQYRIAPMENQERVIDCYNAVKEYLRRENKELKEQLRFWEADRNHFKKSSDDWENKYSAIREQKQQQAKHIAALLSSLEEVTHRLELKNDYSDHEAKTTAYELITRLNK